jgi:D-alanyl-D-alanine carboxypeptidase
MRRGAVVVSGTVLLASVIAAMATALPYPALRSVPPPTPVSGSPSPFPTSLATPKPSSKAPHLEAPEAILEDLDTGQVLEKRRADHPRPIASLTKIMTALIVLERSSLSDVVSVSATAASQAGSELGIRVGERISVRNLLYALLLQSSNDAAVALSEHVGGSVERFVQSMNRRSRQLHLMHTRFFSPTGLDNRGYSTARDLAALTREALRWPEFARVVHTKSRNIPSSVGPTRHVQNRNVLLWLYRGATGVKTGFTSPAGHGLVATAERRGVRLVSVVLGVQAEPFDDGAALLNFGFAGFRRTILVRRGERVGTLSVGGVTIEAVAGADLVRMVRKSSLSAVIRTFRPVVGLAMPVDRGREVGLEVVEVKGRVEGTVPVVAGGLLTPLGLLAGPEPLAGPVRLLTELIRTVFDGFL